MQMWERLWNEIKEEKSDSELGHCVEMEGKAFLVYRIPGAGIAGKGG
jgi:hypothetical protein